MTTITEQDGAGSASTPTSASKRSANRVIETVKAHGVKHIFGIPGGKVMPVYDALLDEGAKVIDCRDERSAAFMAAAMGRLTGTPGVVIVTSGPGTTNLATALVTATTEGDPIVALCGAVPREDRLKRTHQSMDAADFLATVTKYTGEVNDPDNAPEAVANAFRIATTEPNGATALVLPKDVMSAETHHSITAPLPIAPLGAAAAESIDRAVERIHSARRPILLVGARAGDPDSCAAVRELLAATELPVVETFQAAGVVSRELESHYVGRVGLFRDQPGDVLLSQADLVVSVGYDPVEYDPYLWNVEARREIVHIDSLPADIDNHYQPWVELRGNVAATVRALVSPLRGLTVDSAFAADIAACQRQLRDLDNQARQAPAPEGKLNPAKLCLLLRDALDDNTTVAVDMGSHYIHLCRHFRVYEPRHLLISDGQQTLGVGLPWAMAACLARPGTPVVSVSGDGGFLFSAHELETAQPLGLTFTHIIMRDNTWDMVGFQQLLAYGRKSGVELGDYDIPSYAKAFGAHGYRVHDEAEFIETLRQSLAEPGPSIIDVPVDYSHNTDLFAALPEDAFE